MMWPWIKYDTSNLKKLESQLIEDAVSGKLKFAKFIAPTMVSIDHHFVAINARVRLRVDHANIGGTFTFLYVNGQDVSKARSEFDTQRVSYAIQHRCDQGRTLVHDLWNI